MAQGETSLNSGTAAPGQRPRPAAACYALIAAAGRGSRFSAEMPKQYCRLGGMTLLRRSVLAFLDDADIAGVRVVIHPDDRALYDAAVDGLALLPPVNGGATRQESVRRGLESLEPLAPDLVLVHDAARPMLDRALTARVRTALAQYDGAIPALPVVDTLKRAAGGQPPLIAGTVERSGLWRAQTPQGFRFAKLLAAHRRASGREFTDDAAVAEAAGLAVALVDGDERNVKVTTDNDLMYLQRMLDAGRETRSGSGFDVHRFVPGDHVMLCGVKVPHTAGLAGHSDADVALHALTDALLGALAAGDIGVHFPPSDPRWRGAASALFLEHARALLEERNGRLVNVDLTIIGERPRIGPHRAAMQERLSALLRLPAARISIKATTTERLGFTGREEGLAAHAVATVTLPAADPA